jgi:hypothetical protein
MQRPDREGDEETPQSREARRPGELSTAVSADGGRLGAGRQRTVVDSLASEIEDPLGSAAAKGRRDSLPWSR